MRFESSPRQTFRAFFHAQEELKESGQDEEARALADELWHTAFSLKFENRREEAEFFHNFAVFLGSRGPAADLTRSLQAFEVCLGIWNGGAEGDEVARAFHNRANALQNLGTTAEELNEAARMYERALLWRTPERKIARGVTLHNYAAALRRLAELEPHAALEHLARSEERVAEAISIRQEAGLPEGEALSWFHLGLTLVEAKKKGKEGAGEGARSAFLRAAACYEALGKGEEAALARSLADEAKPVTEG